MWTEAKNLNEGKSVISIKTRIETQFLKFMSFKLATVKV